MKIVEWLDKDFNEALIERGWFRKYRARVVYQNGCWKYLSGDSVEYGLEYALSMERYQKIKDRQKCVNWLPVDLPAARVVKDPAYKCKRCGKPRQAF